MTMKNIKYAIILAIFSILLACNKNAGCLSPYNDCNCQDGYEGDNCKTRVTEKFLGKYKLEGLSTSDTTGMTVLDTTSQLKKVYFKNFNYYFDLIGDFYGIVDGDHVAVPKQVPTGRTNFQFVEGEICLNEEGQAPGLIMRLKFNNSPTETYRIVYLRK